MANFVQMEWVLSVALGLTVLSLVGWWMVIYHACMAWKATTTPATI
jgi:uncharacterized membrane protein YhdT